MLGQALRILVLLVAAHPLAYADSDLVGSRDPLGIERFPQSWIVDYRRDDSVQAREFRVGRVERLRREVRKHDMVRLEGSIESAIYRIPDGTPVAEVAAHFRRVMEGGLLYSCSGRDCGRSNEWANQIFGRAILYGPDDNQQYLAWEWQGRLVSVYMIQRGNNRVYANVQVVAPARESDIDAGLLVASRLTAQGWTAIDGITPALDGRLPAGAEQVFAALAPQLAAIADREFYLVCHLYGAGPPGDLVAASERCAAEGVELLNAAVPHIRVQPFGAGPFMPRGANPVPRLELVVPRLLGGMIPAPDAIATVND